MKTLRTLLQRLNPRRQAHLDANVTAWEIRRIIREVEEHNPGVKISMPVMTLADVECEALLALLAEGGYPGHEDLDLLEPVSRLGEVTRNGLFSLLVELRADADKLVKADADMLATGYRVFEAPCVVETATVERNGHVRRRVTAFVGQDEPTHFGIPLDMPLNDMILTLLSNLEPAQRVAFFCELGRCFRFACRAFGSFHRPGGVSVSLCHQIVRLLRAAVRDAREHGSHGADDHSASTEDHVEHSTSVDEEREGA